MKTKISSKYKKLLSRSPEAVIHFSDVFTELNQDFDSELTAIFRNLGTLSDRTYAIGKSPKLGDYGVVLLNDLIEERGRIIKEVKKNSKANNYKHLKNKAVLCVLNCAPRNKETTQGGKNGKDFHLAITDNGLEIYAVPVERLQALESRNKILALYRIPNEDHKFFNGKREQFRSSIIATTRYCPEILETIFEYKNTKELIRAKRDGTHPSAIPEQENLAEYAFADKFGNVRLSVRNSKEFASKFKTKKFGDEVQIRVGKSKPIKAYLVKSLAEIDEEKIGLYKNIADKEDEYSSCEYWEIVKKSKDPNNEKTSAVDTLKKISPTFKKREINIS